MSNKPIYADASMITVDSFVIAGLNPTKPSTDLNTILLLFLIINNQSLISIFPVVSLTSLQQRKENWTDRGIRFASVCKILKLGSQGADATNFAGVVLVRVQESAGLASPSGCGRRWWGRRRRSRRETYLAREFCRWRVYEGAGFAGPWRRHWDDDVVVRGFGGSRRRLKGSNCWFSRAYYSGAERPTRDREWLPWRDRHWKRPQHP